MYNTVEAIIQIADQTLNRQTEFAEMYQEHIWFFSFLVRFHVSAFLSMFCHETTFLFGLIADT